jgi:gamma-glutamyltranspeptidase
VWEVPPPTAGLVALMALNFLEADTSLHLPGRITAEQLAPDQEHPEPQEPKLPPGAHQPWRSTSQAPQGTADGCKSHAWLHSAIESCRLAFADALGYSGDPRVVEVPLQQLLDKQRAQQRRRDYFRADQVGSGDALGMQALMGRQEGGPACTTIVSF